MDHGTILQVITASYFFARSVRKAGDTCWSKRSLVVCMPRIVKVTSTLSVRWVGPCGDESERALLLARNMFLYHVSRP